MHTRRRMESMESDVWTSIVVCCLLSVFFVLSLYSVDPGLPRNHPKTVIRRIWAISTVCIIAPCALYIFLNWETQPISVTMFASSLGIRWNGFVTAVFCPSLLTLILYLGPLFQDWMEGNNSLHQNVILQRKDLVVRNYVIAPLTEELIFRACMLLFLCPAFGKWEAIFVCPLFFGLAHVHHLIDWYRRNDGTSFGQACCSIFVQFCYTSIFGIYTGFLFVRTGHLTSSVLCHSLCNLMGLPSVDHVLGHQKQATLIFAYLLGAIMFLVLLFPLTTPELYSNSKYYY